VSILLLDPNPDSRTSLAELLRMHGYNVLEAASEHEAIQPGNVRLLLVDVGFADVQILRRLGGLEKLPSIALATQPGLRQAALEQGFRDFLLKPLAPADLMQAIDRLAMPPADRDH
jgi:CheY-like chemotaxis protein